MRIIAVFIMFVISAGCMPLNGQTTDVVKVEFFHEEGCSECRHVEDTVFPKLLERYEHQLSLEYCDINVVSNYMRLFRYQELFGDLSDEPVSLVVGERFFLNGVDAISTGVVQCVDSVIAAAEGEALTTNGSDAGSADLMGSLKERARSFSLSAVILLGIVDGFNPCAFTTLIFLISLLSISHKSRRDIVVLAASFCVASFVVYFLIGLGILHSLRLFDGLSGFKQGLEALMGLVLLLLAVLSFVDAGKFASIGKGEAVKVKLPAGLQALSRRILRKGQNGVNP